MSILALVTGVSWQSNWGLGRILHQPVRGKFQTRSRRCLRAKVALPFWLFMVGDSGVLSGPSNLDLNRSPDLCGKLCRVHLLLRSRTLDHVLAADKDLA